VSHLIQNETDPSRLPAAYLSWYDTPVVLRVATKRTQKSQTELHCTIKSESDAAVQIRVGERDQNIRKKMILAVEEIPEGRRRQ
jgi:hypothetical protein